MKITDIYESTTAGAIATVATPMTTQSRNASIYGGKKGGNLLTGKKTNKKYANSVNESKMKELAMDIRDMDNGNFKKKYGKDKEYFKHTLGDPQAKKTVHEDDGPSKYKVTYFNPKLDRTITKTVTAKNESDIWDHCANKGLEVVNIEPAKKAVHEAHLEEDDLILVPGQGHRLKSGFIPHDQDRTDHEVEMAKSDLFQAAKNAKQVYELIHDVTEDEGLEGWVQEKIIKANDYLNTIREYLEGKQLQHNEMNGGVIAGGAGNFEEGIGDTLKQVGKGISDRIKPMTKKSHEEKWYLSGYTLEGKPLGAGMGRARYFTTNQEFPSKKEALYYIKEKQANLNSHGKVGYFSLFVKSSERYFTGEPLFSKIEDPNKEEKVDEEGKGLWANIHAKRERIKHGSGERMRKPGSKGAPSAQDFKDAANEGAMVDNLFKVRFKNTETGETKDIKVRAPSAKEARSQAESDYTHDSRVWKCLGTKEITNEAQTMSGALKNTLAKAEPGSKLDNSIKRHNANIKAGQAGTLKNAPTGYHFDKKGYCRLGDK